MGRPPIGRKPLTKAQIQKRWRRKRTAAGKKAQRVADHRERLTVLQAKADRQSAEVAASRAAFIASPYGHKRWACGIVDVPLDHKTYSDKGRSRIPGYKLLSADALCEFNEDLPFARNAGMYFWAWRDKTEECLQIVKAWGFRKVSTIYWIKTKPDGERGLKGLGYYSNTDPAEELWICRRGNYVAPMLGDGFPHIAWLLPAEADNSTKPQAVYDEIVRLHHPEVELLEMFATKRRPLWWAYGEAIEGMIQPPLDAG